uniref:MBF1 domain-containing protein n=1 Tax=Heterorhabditis bacteriophora TaxID=37862 RepID=A0A1I7XUG3_HETBA
MKETPTYNVDLAEQEGFNQSRMLNKSDSIIKGKSGTDRKSSL